MGYVRLIFLRKRFRSIFMEQFGNSALITIEYFNEKVEIFKNIL